jgi:hypothetical protein
MGITSSIRCTAAESLPACESDITIVRLCVCARGRPYEVPRSPDFALFRGATTIRALLTGLLATFLGSRLTIGIGAFIVAVAALIVIVSPLRNARHDIR